MRTYRPDSWSKQARRIADNYINWEDSSRAWMNFIKSGKSSFIENRIAKRMRRKRFQPAEYMTFEEKQRQEFEHLKENIT